MLKTSETRRGQTVPPPFPPTAIPRKHFAIFQALPRFFAGSRRILNSRDMPSVSFCHGQKITVATPDFKQPAVDRTVIAADFRKIKRGRGLLDFADRLASRFALAAQKIVCAINPGQFVIAGLWIKKHQSAVVTSHHPVIGSRKEIVNPPPLANMTGFDGRSFAGLMAHAIVGYRQVAAPLLRWTRARIPAVATNAITTPAEIQNKAQASRQCRGR
jgi:hypothetical protein